MQIVEAYLTNNDCYKANVKKTDSRYANFKVQGLMVHSVGCAVPDAQRFVTQWNKSGVQKCVHAFVDSNTGIVYQTLPWDFRGWHGGSGSKGSVNNYMIGVEMCESNYIQYTGGSKFKVLDRDKAVQHALTTYKSTVELYSMLCEKYNLNPMSDIISHKEGGQRKIASGHVDPEHYWSGLGLGLTMDTFRTEVYNLLNKKETCLNEAYTQPQTYYAVQKGDTLSKIAKQFGFKSYKELAELNGIKSPYVIKVGQKLRIC